MTDHAESSYVTAVEAIYAAAMSPALWPQTLEAIADVFGDVGAILTLAKLPKKLSLTSEDFVVA